MVTVDGEDRGPVAVKVVFVLGLGSTSSTGNVVTDSAVAILSLDAGV